MTRTWTFALVVVLIAVTAAPTVFHAEHGADQDCTVCAPRNQPQAALSGGFKVRPTETAEPLVQILRITLVFSNRGARIPARSPPLSVFPA